MKLLLVGIDGGDLKIIQRMPMPFLQGVIQSSLVEPVEEDLWSRGWAKIISGASNEYLGAFYGKIDLERSGYWFTQKFNSKSYLNNPSANALWDCAKEAGLSIGLMNFPTTAPLPPNVNGFMVTGAGGGISQKGVGGVPLRACYPSAVKKVLDEVGYVFDIRFKASGIKKLSELIESLIKMHTARVSGFIALQKIYQVDIGAVAFMSTTRIQYVAMYDIWYMIKDDKYFSQTTQQIEKLFKSFDDNLKRLFNEVNPKNFVVASDHGQARRLGTVNLNAFLEKKGFLNTYSKPVDIVRKVINRFYKPVFGFPVKRNSIAFTGRYVSGIYINDVKRFKGRVAEKDIDYNVNKIISIFNSDPEAQRNGLSAKPFRKLKDSVAPYYDYLPDIWIDRPDELFFEAKGNFIEPNEEFGPIGEDLSKVSRDQFTGVKGRCPLFIYNHGLLKYKEAKEETLDLTSVNGLIVSFLKSREF